MVSAVDTAACQNVNHATSQVRDLASVALTAAPSTARATNARLGQT